MPRRTEDTQFLFHVSKSTIWLTRINTSKGGMLKDVVSMFKGNVH